MLTSSHLYQILQVCASRRSTNYRTHFCGDKTPLSMVKLYERFEQDKVFGVIAGLSNVVWLPHTNKTGRALVGGLEAVMVWDIKTGELVDRLVDGLVPGASNAPTQSPPSIVTLVCHFNDTNLVGVGYSDGLVKVWDLTSKLVMVSLNGHRSPVTHVHFDTLGTRLVTGSADTTIIVWDLVAEEGLFRLKGHKGPITGLALVGQDDEFIVSCSKDGMVKLWEMASQQCVETYLGHGSECWALAVFHEDLLMVTSGKDSGDNKVWAIDTTHDCQGQRLVEQGTFSKQSHARTHLLAFHGRQLMVQNADKTIELFRFRASEEITKGSAKRTKRLRDKGYSEEEISELLTEQAIAMLVAPSTILRAAGKVKAATWLALGLVLLSLQNSLEFWLVEAVNKEVVLAKTHTVELPGHRTDVRAVDILSDGQMVVLASQGELKVWNIKTAKVIRLFSTRGHGLCCKFLPGNTLVAVGYKLGHMELFDLATLAVIDEVVAHGSGHEDGAAVWLMDVTTDGTTLVTGGNDKLVKFWRFKVEENYMGVPLMRFKHHRTLELAEDVLSVKISPDTRFVAVSLLNNNIQVVFFDTLKLYLTLYGHKLPVLSIDISQDSKLLILSSADKNIKIWGLDFGDCHKLIFAHQDLVMNVKFVGESHHFFSSGKDGLIKYWDGDKFECIQRLPAHQLEVWCIALDPVGEIVVSASHDHSLRLWRLFGDQVFIEEEREKEMDELYEDDLVEKERTNPEEEVVDTNERVTKQTLELLKLGEKVMEALDIGYKDWEAMQRGETYVNPILLHMKVTGPEYVLDTIKKIKPSQIDDALLVLPFLYTLKLLQMVEVWTSDENGSANLSLIQLICRVLFFVVRTNARELVLQRDAAIRKQLDTVKSQLRTRLSQSANTVGENTAAMKFVKQQWRLNHESSFSDEQVFDKNVKKRIFTTVV